jgi:hypothetical protein
MSTPRNSRRHVSEKFDQELLEHRSTDWTAGIHDLDIAACFAHIISEFEHIEDGMVSVFAGLLGVQESAPARVVYHTLRNPSIKFDILRTLLESSPTNTGLGAEFDKLLTDYNSLRIERNQLAHGLWWTDSSGRVHYAQHALNGQAILEAKEVTVPAIKGQLAAQRAFRKYLYEVHVEKRFERLQEQASPDPAPTT